MTKRIASITFMPTGEVRLPKENDYYIPIGNDPGPYQARIDHKDCLDKAILTRHIRYVGDPPVLDPEIRRALSWFCKRQALPSFAIELLAERLGVPAWDWQADLADPPKPEEPSTKELIVMSSFDNELDRVLCSIDRRLTAMEKKV